MANRFSPFFPFLCSAEASDPTLRFVALNNIAAFTNEYRQLPPFAGTPSWFLRNCLCEPLSATEKKMEGGYRGSTALNLTRQQLLPFISNVAHAMLKVWELISCVILVGLLVFDEYGRFAIMRIVPQLYVLAVFLTRLIDLLTADATLTVLTRKLEALLLFLN